MAYFRDYPFDSFIRWDNLASSWLIIRAKGTLIYIGSGMAYTTVMPAADC